MRKVNDSGDPYRVKLSRRAAVASLGMAALAVPIATGCKAQTAGGVDMNNGKKIIIVLTNHEQLGDTGRKTGFYLSEVSHPYEEFRKAGFDVDFVSPSGGPAPMDGVDRKDPTNAAFLDDAGLVERTRRTFAASEVDAAKYAAIFYAGGHGAMWDLPSSVALQSLTARIYDHGGIVAAVCHGPAGIVNVRLGNGNYLVAGKRVTAFTDAEEAAVGLTSVVPFLLEKRLKERGAEFAGAPNFQENVVISERLATGQNPASARKLARLVVQGLQQ